MGKIVVTPPEVRRAAEMGMRGESSNVTVDGVVLNPFSHGTRCYWAWYGANLARKGIGTN